VSPPFAHQQVPDTDLDERLTFTCVAELFVEADGVIARVELDLREPSLYSRLLEVTHERATDALALLRRVPRHLAELSTPRRTRREHHARDDSAFGDGSQEHRIVLILDDHVGSGESEGFSQNTKA